MAGFEFGVTIFGIFAAFEGVTRVPEGGRNDFAELRIIIQLPPTLFGRE